MSIFWRAPKKRPSKQELKLGVQIRFDLSLAVTLIASAFLASCAGNWQNRFERAKADYAKRESPKAFAIALLDQEYVWGWSEKSDNLQDAEESALIACEKVAATKTSRLAPCHVTMQDDASRSVPLSNLFQSPERLAVLKFRASLQGDSSIQKRCQASGRAPTQEFGATERVELCYANRVVVGKWKGTGCGRNSVELTVTGAKDSGDRLEFFGSVTVAYAAGRVVTRNISGHLRYVGGFIHTEPVVPPPSLMGFEPTQGFRMNLARSASGTGLTGVAEGAPLDGCGIELSRVDKLEPTFLPKPTLASVMAEKRFSSFTATGLSHWLDVGASTGSKSAKDYFEVGEAFARIGRAYYPQAQQYYLLAATQKPPHASAQAILSEMHLKGIAGRDKNPQEGKRWRDLSAPVMTAALRVCRAEPAMAKVRQKSIGSSYDKLASIWPINVYTIDSPFECEYKVLRPEVEIDLSSEPLPRGPFDPPPSPYELPDGASGLLDALFSRFATEMLNMPKVQTISVAPLGSGKFQLSHEDGSAPVTVTLR